MLKQNTSVPLKKLQIELRKRGADVTIKSLSMRVSRGAIQRAQGKGKCSVGQAEFEKILEMADCSYPRRTAEEVLLASGISKRRLALWLGNGKLPSVKKYGERWVFKPAVDSFARKLAHPLPQISPQNAFELTFNEAISELATYGINISGQDLLALACEGLISCKTGSNKSTLPQSSVDLIAKLYFSMRGKREKHESKKQEDFSYLVHEPLLDCL